MIFKAVSNLGDKNERTFFKEKILIFIRLIEVFCEKNKLKNNANEIGANIHELIDIGVIETENEIEDLKKLLGSLYYKFIKAVNFTVDNKEKIGDLVDKLHNKKRLKYQEKKDYTLIDFFCGAGGLSLGFIQEGFGVELANDIEDVCIETYKYNHPEMAENKLIKGDIKSIVENLENHIYRDIDVVVGGPPCQGFSEANRQRIIDDPRNELYKYFLKAVEKIGPKFVVMENVKGMRKVASQIIEDYNKIVTKNNETYTVDYKILNSQNFSVAQSRERLIFIAIRSDIIKNKKISPKKIFEIIEKNCASNKIFNLEDALDKIKKLEAPRIKNMNEIDNEITGKKIDINLFSENNKYLDLINLDRVIQYTFNHKARYCNEINYEIYKRLNPGDDATNEKIMDIMPYSHRNHCFKDKYYKLIPDKPSRTITAHLKMDCHSHIHPFQIRAITPREAARIQSFPDDYLFLGAFLKTYMQIGNAVPPLMGRGIAKVIKQFI